MERYNAFISYRHSPNDIKVAAEIQKQLERFHIPGPIRKVTGIQKISRIFRDKEELSLTGDLNETIQNALDHSDFLILICSPAMKESFWVQKELEYFLKSHNKCQILTVISEGEPCDVLPEILCYEEMLLPNEQGEEEMVKVPVEPLSCDYRMSFRKAKREELPRLAAPMIGCSYDDLRRRQRQYRMRRMAAVFSAAALLLATLSVYFAWSAAQIQSNYEKSLINQSEYLAAESRALLSSGDRLNSILLALEALPDEGGDRPVVTAAIHALTDSTYAYVSPGRQIPSLETMVRPGGRIEEFFADGNERYLAMKHDSYCVSIWDIEEQRYTMQSRLSKYITTIRFTEQGDFVILVGNEVQCYDAASGTQLWSYTVSDTLFMSDLTLTPSSGNIVIYDSEQFFLLDSKTGALLTHWKLPEAHKDLSISSICFSPDESLFALSCGVPASRNLLICTEEDSLLFTPEEGYIRAVTFDKDGALYLSVSRDQYNYFTSGNEALYTSDNGYVIKLRATGEVLWKAPINSYHMISGDWFYFTEFLRDDETIPVLLYCYSNLCYAICANSGEILSREELLASIIDTYPVGVGVHCLLSNGDLAICNPSTSVIKSIPCFVSDCQGGLLGSGLYILDSSSTSLLIYSEDIFDQNWTPRYTLDSSYYAPCSEGILFVSGSSSVSYLSSPEGAVRWVADTELSISDITVLGSFENQIVAMIRGKDQDGLTQTMFYLFQTEDGTQRHFTQENAVHMEAPVLNKGIVYYFAYDWNEDFSFYHYIACLDLRNGEMKQIRLPDEQAIPDNLFLSPSGDSMIMANQYGQYTRICEAAFLPLVTSDSDEIIPFDRLISAVWSEDESLLALTEKEQITLYNQNYEPIVRISIKDQQVGWIGFWKQNLLVVTEEAFCRYDLSGRLLTEISIDRVSTPCSCTFSVSQRGSLALLVDQQLFLINTADWQCYASVSDCIYYDQDNKIIYTLGEVDDVLQVGSYEEYDLSELMEMAKEQVGNLQLAEEDKAKYGLS